jgi:hypothetical protein
MNWTAWKTNLALPLAAFAWAALPAASWGQANTCNGLVTIDYVTGSNYAVPGDVIRVRLTLGTGSINGGTHLTIQRLRFDLDCDSNFALGLPCTDEGAFVQYEGDGTITNTCGKIFTTGHAVSSAPNEVVFTPDTPIVIPANSSIPPGFCALEFDIKVLAAPSTDVTPGFIEEVGGYRNVDAMCNNGVLASGGQQSSAIPLCPACNDTNVCTNDICNQTTGQCEFPPVQDSTPCGDVDNDACTTAGCEQGSCVQAHMTTPCPPDGNPCTQDPACNPSNGLCEKPPEPDSTPCPEADGNLCTTAGCEAGQCVQAHQTTPCAPDTNVCTLDPPCNPTNGLCEHPPVPDSTPCPDTDGNVCSLAGCEAGSCMQLHVDSCINHFSCYEIKPFAFTPVPNVSLVDTFGSSTTTVSRPTKFCAPADKNDEDPNAPDHPDHLTGYKTRNPSIKRVDQTIVNQFHPTGIRLDVVKTVLLFVPTAKSLVAPAPPEPVAPTIDHFQCYKVRKTRGTPRFVRIPGVKVDDQFGTGTFDLIKPRHLCAPANKNNEAPGAKLHPQFLLCYKVKASAPFTTKQVWLGNQFGPHDNLSLVRRQEFCVPSALNPTSTTTTTVTTTTVTTTTAPTSTTTTITTTTVTTTTAQSPSGAFVD